MARSASDSPSTPPQRRSPRSGRSPRSARRSSSPYEPYEPDAAASPTDDPTLLPTDDPTLLPIDDVHRIAIVGTGIIGSGWAALFLAHGYEVTAYVRSAQSQTKFLAALQRAHGRLVARGIATASDGWRSVVCTSTLAEAVSTADYVQESVSETLHLKQNILAQIARHARPGVLIGTSSSYLPRSLAAALVCRGHSPERIVTAHPSIPDLDSFVEVYGGGTPSGHARTAWLAGLFGSEGVHMDVVLLQRETPGHALNMFNAAIGATAIALVNGGVCAADDVDKALVHLGGLLVAAGGLSGAMVGMVGGGSEVASMALAREAVLSTPLAWSSCVVEWCLGEGLAARCVLCAVRASHGVYLRSGCMRTMALRAVQMWSAPLNEPHKARWEAAGADAFDDWALNRLVALGEHVTPL